MSRLLQNSMPAEIVRGCVFSESFRSPQEVVQNGGSITGSPTIYSGIDLNGTTDYINYRLTGNEFNFSEISILIEFSPDFATNANQHYYLLDSTVGYRYYIRKSNNTSNNVLSIIFGNTSVAGIPEATYSPYWSVGNRNVLIISGTTGDTSAWLNGNEILTNDITAWTPAIPANMTVGANISGSFKFDGRFSKIQIYNALLTRQEAIDFYGDSTYSYFNKSVLYYPMRSSLHDVDNNKTIDVSGKGNSGTFGDGSTQSKFPTKLSKSGYSFDGTDYLDASWQDGGSLDIQSGAMVAMFKTSDSTKTSPRLVEIGTGTGHGDRAVLYLKSGDSYKISGYLIRETGDIVDISGSDSVNDGKIYVAAFSFDQNGAKLYLNGEEVNSYSGDCRLSLPASSELYICRYVDAVDDSYNLIGNIYTAALYNDSLSGLQMIDLYLKLIKVVDVV